MSLIVPGARLKAASGTPASGAGGSAAMRIFSGRSATVTAMPSVPVMPWPTQ
jgi:hypothetical protein